VRIQSAKSVPRIAAAVKRPYALDVQRSARYVKSLYAQGVLESNVPNAKPFVANHVSLMVCVQTVNKKERLKMMDKENKLQEQAKAEPQATLKQVLEKSSWQAERREARRLSVRFSPTGWAKLLYFRDKMDNEIGGFGITEPDDLLFVKEFVTVKQEVTGVSVKFDDGAVGDFFDSQVDLGKRPEEFARIWLHTHPGDSPGPSAVDEETFQRVFGTCQWAVMFVLAQDNKTYARLSFNVGPGGQVLIPTEIDCSKDFGPTDRQAWDVEYAANVKAMDWFTTRSAQETLPARNELSGYALPYDFIDEFKRMEPAERQFVLDELAERPDLWDEKDEVMFL
jgi:proteasome lid subunit RPN8/RPN11